MADSNAEGLSQASPGVPKLGFGFYIHMLDDKHYQFARQCGATHAVVHLVDYKYRAATETLEDENDQPLGNENGWGEAGHTIGYWNKEFLRKIKADMADHGLDLVAVENFDPIDWYDVLLDGPERDTQIETLKQRVRTLGEAGISTLGYNFSITGVTSRTGGPFARGKAHSVGMSSIDDRPLPSDRVWNMRIPGRENGPPPESATEEQLWDRWYRFMKDLLPVAKEAGVVLAAHPDDPPVERVRQQPKLGWNGERYLRIVEELDSPFNRLELCLGTLAEMADHDVYATVERAASRNRIGYIHFRNVVGSAPDYREVFLDEGKLDVDHILRILKAVGYDGVMVPDHTPLLTCDAPWHAGMAYAMGYLKASIDRIRDEG